MLISQLFSQKFCLEDETFRYDSSCVCKSGIIVDVGSEVYGFC